MKKMTQSDHEIKTKKTISRDFVQRDVLSEKRIVEPTTQEDPSVQPTSRREVIQNLIPSLAEGAGTILRSLSVKLAETLEKIEKF